ncbi:MFS general substrate transporter [Rickenella mellea]|uniref:MFS general substrate transporter n=1 Tax=Rickenella mellea TaxID=50990 RepID=A0A4Y7QBW7_9AGAM|nr:MFS general substrate transporter [Rickenella mellea]
MNKTQTAAVLYPMPQVDVERSELQSGSVPPPKPAYILESIELPTLSTAPQSSATSLPSLASAHYIPAITPGNKRVAVIQFAALCFSLFLIGWGDGSSGPLLPRIQQVYHVQYAVVALLFVMNCIGYLIGAAMNVYMTDKFGFGKVMVIGAMAQTIGFAMEAPAPPFPIMCIAFIFTGWGVALQAALGVGYVASLKTNAAAKMGFTQAMYGLGAFCSPLVATQFAHLHRWSFHYLVSFALGISNILSLMAAFRGKTQEECLQAIGEPPAQASTSNDSKYRQLLRLKTLHLLAFWAILYVGVEVTIGGWTVTYIIQDRGGGPSAGYISSGFFGGLTLGRVALLWVNRKVGERRVLLIYGLLAIALELTIWLVPSLIGNAVAVSIVGMLLGPMFPILMNQSAKLFPPWLLTGSIGWIAGVGQAGSALLPFLTGALAAKFGIQSLQPFLIVVMSLIIIVWLVIPKSHRRED